MGVDVNGGALQFEAVITATQFNAAISAIEKKLEGLTKTAEREAAAIDNVVKRAAQGIAAYASFSTATNFISDIVKVRGEFQQLEVAFRTMLGSKEKADKLFKEAVDLAAKTPFTLQDVGNATKQLLAYGFAADDITGNIKRLGNIASGVGAPLNDIIYLYGTLRTQGRAYQRDIMQFTSRGIPVISELAKQFGVTESEVQKLVEAGKVGFPEIEKVMIKLTSAGGMFFNLMEEQSKTLTGQISNLQDACSRMLNDIGKSNEGVLSGTIGLLTDLVNNYEKVLDVLKLLVVTYGSYKAAVIATTAVQAIQTELTKGYTLAETLRLRAMILSERAMKLLNRTMLANPFVAVATAAGALVAAFLIFNKTASQTKTKTELIAEANAKLGDRLAETEAKIKPYMEALKNANISEQQRVEIYEKLKAIDPKIVEGLTAKTLSYEKLAANVNLYLDALRKQIALETNKEALQASLKEENTIKNKIAENEKLLKSLARTINNANEIERQSKTKSGVFGTIVALVDQQRQQLKEQQKVSEQLATDNLKQEATKQDAKRRTLAVIEEEIKAEKEKQTNFSETSKQYQEYQKNINKLEAEKRAIVGASKQEAKAAETAENKALAMLEKRKSILEQIVEQQTKARQSGETKQLSELDKINERYDEVLKNITEYNDKVDQFNKKNPNNQVQKIGQVDIIKLNEARKKELDNQSLKDDAARYKASLDQKMRLFEQFEQAKKDVGEQKANEMFSGEVKAYSSYLELLKAEAEKIAPKIVLGVANIGEIEKFKAITDQIRAYTAKKNDEDIEQQKRNFVELLQATVTFNDAKKAINKKYDDLEKTLNKNGFVSDFEDRKKLLQQARAEELQELKNQLIRQSDLYRRLNQDIIGFTRQRLKDEIKLFKEKLKADATLTPEQKANIQATIDQYKSLLDQTNETAKRFDKLAGKLSDVSGIFGDLADALTGVNDGLADTLNTMAEIASIGANAASAVASFATGDIVGGIQKSIKAIVGIFEIGKKSRESERRAQEEIEAFNFRILAGEIQITEEIRNRQREQVKLNKLKLDGLADEKKLLKEQKKAVAAQYNDILTQLQAQSAVVGETTKKYGGFLGVGRKTKVVQITETLAGKSFDDLQALFDKGQLVGKAKDLFELLQKIKAEGVDIDAQLAQNAEEAKQIFTGTTSESISDSIIEGFKNGLHSASDFAGTFEDLMRNALIQSLKFKYLEGPLKDFFDQFAAASQSDGQLTNSEIANLRETFGNIINNANEQFKQLQQIAGINFAGSGSGAGNNLVGALKGMTEGTAELLAGQFGGLRITAIEHLAVGRNQLTTLNAIQINTATQVVKVMDLLRKFDTYETGGKYIYVKVI